MKLNEGLAKLTKKTTLTRKGGPTVRLAKGPEALVHRYVVDDQDGEVIAFDAKPADLASDAWTVTPAKS